MIEEPSDFRTWAGTVLASAALREFEEYGSETEAKKKVVEAIKAVAQQQGNTPAVCRKCYVDPAVRECYLAGKLERRIQRKAQEAPDEMLHEAKEEALRKEERAITKRLNGSRKILALSTHVRCHGGVASSIVAQYDVTSWVARREPG